MKNMTLQVLQHLSAIPLSVWIALILYGASMFLVNRFGIPLKKFRRDSYETKEVSHGIVSHLEKVRVYHAWYTEANIITLLGIVGLIVMFFMIITNTLTETLPLLFLLSAVYSDLLDGKAAKRWDCHSKIGAIIDPIRDRLAVLILLTAIITKAMTIWFLIPLTVMFLFEIGVASIALKARKKGIVLNSHGPGEKRQVVHLLMIETMLTSSYVLNIETSTLETIAVSTASIMALASIYAYAHYRKLHKETAP